MIISTGWVLPIGKALSQVEDGAFGFFNEALLFSQTNPGGSARIQGIGGAQMALGGDISSIYSNPAGLGLYNRSEFSITPAINFYQTTSTFLGNSLDNSGTKFVIGNLSLVFNRTRDDLIPGAWRGGSFGISINRINDFNRTFTYEASNPNNSIIDSFIQQAEGLTPSQLTGLTGFAFDHFLINPIGNGNNSYDSFVLGFPNQRERVNASGSQYQWSFSYGGNLADKFYFGLGLGINTLSYEQTKTFEETEYFDSNFPNDPEILSELSTRESLDINGIGINGTFGLMFRPIDRIRVGISVVTPTAYTIDDESDFDLFTEYNNYLFVPEDTTLNQIFSLSDIFVSDYSLTVPWRFNTGAAFFFSKNGFISADLEFVNYGNIKLGSDDFPPEADNTTINNLYQSTVNFKVGAEYRLKALRLRAGFAHLGDPFAINDGGDRSKTNISGGFGFRNALFYGDFAIVASIFDSLYSPYSLAGSSSPRVTVENQITSAVLTFGLFF